MPQYTKNFTGKSPAEVASIMKAERGGVKRNAEIAVWPQIEQAKLNEDKPTVMFWCEVIQHLAEGTEDPKVDTVEPFTTADLAETPPQLELA